MRQLLQFISSTLMLAVSLPAISEQRLVKVGAVEITRTDLRHAMSSAPFATAFPSMDEDKQAALRGDMLLRLVNAELLRQEAMALQLDTQPAIKKDIERYRDSMLYQQYIRQLKDSIKIPAEEMRAMKARYRGKPDALAAARSTYLSRQYKTEKQLDFAALRKRYKVQVNNAVLKTKPDANSVIATGSFFKITYGDISDKAPGSGQAFSETEQLDELLEIKLAAHTVEKAGIRVDKQIALYKNELLPQWLLKTKEHEWIADETVLRDYYQQHPQLSTIPARQHIGQLVLTSCQEAATLRKRIMAGESLFELASKYSIDPLGRKQAGDMGWVKTGTGLPELEAVVKELQPGDISKPVSTLKGCHLITLIERAPGRQRAFAEVKDAVREALLREKLGGYLNNLAKKYPVKWALPVQGVAASDAGS